MDNSSLIQIAIMAMAALSVGLIAFAVAYPYLSGERQAGKRMAGVTQKTGRVAGGSGTGSESQEALQERRKQIENTLNDIESKKTKKRLNMRMRLVQAGLEITTRSFYMVSAIAGLVVFGLTHLTHNPMWVSVVSGLVAATGLPRWIVGKMIKRRQAKFIEQFSSAIDVVVRGVKSGLPLNDCMGILAVESSDPLKSEFRELVEQQRVGVPLVECFNRMLDRMPLQEVNFFAIVIAIQQQAGGNLAEALGNLSQVLRDRKGLSGKVKALSSEARTSALILGLMPFCVMISVYMMAPEYIAPLWQEKMGQMMLMGSAVWMTIGILIMRSMINFKY